MLHNRTDEVDSSYELPSSSTTRSAAYGNIGSRGNIDLQMMEFRENVDMSAAKTVSLTGGYDCLYGAKAGDSVIRGSLTVSGNSGPVAVDAITIR